jgi:hypothetical protein
MDILRKNTWVFQCMAGFREAVRKLSNVFFRAIAGTVFLITCCLYVPGMCVLQAAESLAAKTSNSQTTVTITPYGATGVARKFRVVLLCDTPDTRTIGLQGFGPLAKDEAALFVFYFPAPATFWMGSVSFPIDIIFVGPDKRVIKVYEDCNPGSRDLYPSGTPVQWVVETAAGSGVKIGDSISIK